MKNKSEVLDAFKIYKAYVEKQVTKSWRCDLTTDVSTYMNHLEFFFVMGFNIS